VASLPQSQHWMTAAKQAAAGLSIIVGTILITEEVVAAGDVVLLLVVIVLVVFLVVRSFLRLLEWPPRAKGAHSTIDSE
jgi:hypothetical protein